MSAPHFATVADVEPVVELGIGQTYGGETTAGRWDLAHWDDDTDAHWSGLEPSWVDVTCDVRAVDSTVGHDRTLDTWDVGTCTVTVDNASGWADLTLDPLDPDALDLRPGRAIRWGIRHAVAEVPGIEGYLDHALGTVATVDTPDMVIDGAVRVTFRTLFTSMPAGAITHLSKAGSGAAGREMIAYTYGGNNSLSFSSADMALAVTRDGLIVSPVPLGAAHVFGWEATPGSTRFVAIVDGTRTVRTLTPNAQAYPDTTAPVVIGTTQLPGRTYWAQLEAINRAQLVFPGLVGNHLTVPHAANLNPTGDVEIVVRASMPNWYDAAAQNQAGIVGKFTTGARSYILRRTGASMQFVFTPTGGATQTFTRPTPAGLTANQLVWYRYRYDADNGAGGIAVTLDYSIANTTTEPTSWTNIGGTSTYTPAAALSTNTYPVTIGSDDPSRAMLGRIARVIVRNAFGSTSPVLDVSETNVALDPTGKTFLAVTGQTVTVRESPRFVFPGVAGNYMSVPDAAPLRVTGDIEIVARIAPTDWTPAATITIVGRWTTNASYLFRLATSGALQLNFTTNGSTSVAAQSTAAVAAADGSARWVKVTRVAASGLVRFYTAPDAPTEPTTWTQLGTDVTMAAGGIFAGTSPLEIGTFNTGTSGPFAGRIARAIVRNGIAGTVVLDVAEANAPAPGVTSFPATTGGTVTVTQTVGTTIVQDDPTTQLVKPQADRLIWRFDPVDYKGDHLSYTDPRGRAWSLSALGAVTPTVPTVPAHIATTWRFRGFIDAMRATYEGPHAETDSATLDAIDALGEVARVQLAKLAAPVGDGESVNARLHRLLDVVGWRTEWRDIAASNVPVFATDLGAQAADLLGRTADTAAGALFGDYDGRVAFRNRDWQTWVPGTPPDLVLGNTAEATVCPSSIEVAFPRAGTTTRSLVNYEGAEGPPVQRDDLDAQVLYGVETAPERLDLQTDDPTQLDILADRLLATRGVATMPRVNALTLDAGRDTATMLACLDADPQRPSRWRLVVERAGRLLLDRMLIVTAVSHSWDAGGWHTAVRLDDATPWAAAGGRWDGAYWDAATWASGSDLVAQLEALLAALEAAT